MRKVLVFATAAVAVGVSAGAHATTIDLTFDGIAPTYPFSSSSVLSRTTTTVEQAVSA
jgi:hypothetical protein